MPLTDLVAPNAILPALKINNKKQALHELAARAAVLSGQSEKAIFEILMQREKLGSTAIGNGIAIPHGKMANLSRLFGLFARLDRPIDFEALDGQPVDLIFLLLAFTYGLLKVPALTSSLFAGTAGQSALPRGLA